MLYSTFQLSIQLNCGLNMLEKPFSTVLSMWLSRINMEAVNSLQDYH